MKIYYVLNARMPNKKAYGIHVAKMCEAFIEAGADLELVIPRTHASSGASLRNFYKLRVDVPVTVLPGLDWYGRGRYSFFISSLTFMITSQIYLSWKRLRGVRGVVYTIDMDTFSFSFLPFSGFPVYSEMHDEKPDSLLRRAFFRSVRGIIVLNSEVRDHLQRTFNLPLQRFHIDNNGVESTWFTHIAREKARAKLSIPLEARIVSYVGRFYDWKGLGMLPHACALVPGIECRIVGGTREEFENIPNIGPLPENMRFIGECASDEVPLHLAVADALLVIGTKGNESMYRYRSPMKTYEYMAARRPVVAPRIPAITCIASEAEALFYEVDDARSLSEKMAEAVAGGPAIEARVASAFNLASTHTWADRARRILHFLDEK